MAPTIIESTFKPARALLYAHPGARSLACLLMQQPGASELLERGDVTWDTFPDGWPNVWFSPRHVIEGRNVVVLLSLHHPAPVVEQHAFLVALARQRPRSMHVFVPYFGPGTMERVARENEVATAEPFFKLLTSAMPPLTGGAATFTVFDPHALVTRFYATDNVTVVQQSAFSLALKWVHENKATVVFPDDGAAKRFGPLFVGVPTLTCAKKRGSGEERYITFADQEPEKGQRRALIVDDLCQTGGTIAECAKKCGAPYFESVSAFCVHAVFPGDAHTRFMRGGKNAGLLDNFFVCNTNQAAISQIEYSAAHLGDKTFTVWDISPLVLEQVRRDLGQQIAHERVVRAHTSGVERIDAQLMSTSGVKRRALERALKKSDFLSAASDKVFGQPSMPGPYEFLRTPSFLGTCSGVSVQPLSEEETLRGAEARHAAYARYLEEAERSDEASSNTDALSAWSIYLGAPVAQGPAQASKMDGAPRWTRKCSLDLPTQFSVTSDTPSLRACKSHMLVVSVESGIWKRDTRERANVWQDTAIVIVERRGAFPNRVVVRSEGVAAPNAEFMQRVIAAKGTLTYGTLVHDFDPAKKSDEWFDRETQIADAIELALKYV